MVVDAIIRHWVTVVTPSEAGTGGLGMTIIDLAAYFYANNGLVALAQPERLQRAFEVLTSLFNWIGLKKKRKRQLAWSSSHATHRGGR